MVVVQKVLVMFFMIALFDLALIQYLQTSCSSLISGLPKNITFSDKYGLSSSIPTNEKLQWLDISDGKKFSNYGDPDCPGNSYRYLFKSVLRAWVRIAGKNSIPYFLTSGSLLGAYRNGDVIPYDSDIDIMIDSKYNTVLEEIAVERNFDTGDTKMGLIIQTDFREPFAHRRRFDCRGQVIYVYFVPVKDFEALT